MDNRYDAIDSPVAGTCEWLFSHLDFQAWRDPEPDKPLSDRLLWLRANAGAGKSTLMKAVYQDSRKEAISYTLCYFFNARSPVQALDNSFCGMLRNLLWRLLTYDSSLLSGSPELSELKQRNRKDAEKWHPNKVKDLFSRCLRKVKGKSVYMYIDALDECPEDEARTAIRFFEDLAEQIGAVRLLFSSRFCPFISHKGHEIDMGSHNARDIRRYLNTYMPSIIDGKSSQSLRNLIGTRSSGIFLWTVLTVNEVIKANDQSLSYRDIQDLVEKIPPDLKPIIEDMLRKINPVHKSKACLIFNWVLLASDPLHPLEILAMNRFDPQNPAANDAREWQFDSATMERAIRNFSGGLLEVKSTVNSTRFPDQGRQYVQFIHESVRDHLQTSKLLKRLLTESPALELIPNHTSLVEFCVDYIGQVPGFGDKLLVENEIAKLLDIHADVFRLMCAYAPLFEYHRNELWYSHRRTIPFDVAEEHKAPTIDRLRAGLSSEQCDQLSEYLAGDAWVSDLVTLAAKVAEAGNYIFQSSGLGPKCDNLRKIVELLAPYETRYPSFRKGETVLLTIKTWHDDAMRRMYRRLKTPFPLLRRTIDEIFLHLKVTQNDTALERLTVFLIAENPFPKKNLLHSMICVNNYYSVRNQLEWLTGKSKIQKFDFTSYREGSEPNWHNQAVVRLAAGYGLRSLLEKLLALSPHNLNYVDSHGWNPFDHALASGCVSTSALLLHKGAEIDMNKGRGYAATTIMRHGTSFAETLISHLVKSKHRENILGRLLVSSVYASKLDLIDCLSKGGADFNATFDDGRDALIIASRLHNHDSEQSIRVRLGNKDSEEVIKALVRYGATPHCVDRFGRTALHYLSTNPDCKTVEMLLRGKPDVNVADRTGQTPLDFALTHGNNDVAELLRLHGAISGSCATVERVHDDQHSTTTKSSDEWCFESDPGSPIWDSDSAD